ncbi:flagellar hook-length control protein FliK [Nitrobacteraceae bacterium AZCC 2146]
MVSVTSDIASNVSFQNARSKSARDDQPSDSDRFGSLVDSSTAANSNNDRAASALPDLPAPTPPPRDDNRPARTDDTPRRDDDRADTSAASNSQDRDVQAQSAADAAKEAKQSKADSKTGAKTDTKTDKDSSAKDTKTTDASTATDPNAAPQIDKAVPVTAVAVVIPVVTATADTTATPATTANAGTAQPLAIAAAVLKAQAAAAEAAAATGTGTEAATATAATATPASTDQDFAALIASATPATAKTGAKQAKQATEATTAATTDVKSDAVDATVTAATSQPVQATTTEKHPVKEGKEGKADEVSADGAKPDPTATSTKPATAHEHRTIDTAAAAQTVDASQPNTNTAQQPLLQAATPAAAPAPQLTAAVATNAPVPLNGVAVEIAQSAQSGKSRFDIRLDPAELGRIDVRLDVDRHGNVTSHLTVEKPETLAMLRQDAPQLQRALEQAGMKTSDGGLQFSLRDQSSSGQQNSGDNSGRNAQRLIISEDDSMPAVSAGRSYGRMLGSSSGVDISI